MIFLIWKTFFSFPKQCRESISVAVKEIETAEKEKYILSISLNSKDEAVATLNKIHVYIHVCTHWSPILFCHMRTFKAN